MIVGPDYKNGRNGGRPDNRGVGRRRGLENLLRGPPRRKGDRYNLGAGTNL